MNFSFLVGQGQEGKNIQKSIILKKYLKRKGRLQAAAGGRQPKIRKKH